MNDLTAMVWSCLQTVTNPPVEPPGTTPPVNLGMPLIVGFIVVFFFALGYRWYKANIASQLELLTILHFRLDAFNDDTEAVDLSAYNRKYGLVVAIGGTSMFAVPAIAAAAIPITMMTIRGMIMVMGWGLLALFLWMMVREMTLREITENQNAVWGDVELYIPGFGSIPRIWRNLELEKEIKLTEVQLIAMVDKMIEGAKLAKITVPRRIKKELLLRLKKMHIYRAKVMKMYRVLIFSQTSWNEMVNPNTDEMFNRTTDVVIKRMPMDIVYISESTRIWRDVDKKGVPFMNTVTMGVFMVVVDRKKVEERMIKGRFDTPDIRDSYVSLMVQQHEQESITARYANAKTDDLNKKEKELKDLKHKKTVDSQVEFNVYVRGFKRLFEPIGGRQRLSNLLGYFIAFGAIWYFIFSMFGWIG